MTSIVVIISEVPSTVDGRELVRLTLTDSGYEIKRITRRGYVAAYSTVRRTRDQAMAWYMLAKREGIVYCTFEGLGLPSPVVARKMAVVA